MDRIRTEGSDKETQTQKKSLSKKMIIDAANRVARRYDLDPKKVDIIYDENNARWSSFPHRGPLPALEGHDYQVVLYLVRETVPSEPLTVFVDRNTGKVLKILVGAWE
jgi:hypothetical protein